MAFERSTRTQLRKFSWSTDSVLRVREERSRRRSWVTGLSAKRCVILSYAERPWRANKRSCKTSNPPTYSWLQKMFSQIYTQEIPGSTARLQDLVERIIQRQLQRILTRILGKKVDENYFIYIETIMNFFRKKRTLKTILKAAARKHVCARLAHRRGKIGDSDGATGYHSRQSSLVII